MPPLVPLNYSHFHPRPLFRRCLEPARASIRQAKALPPNDAALQAPMLNPRALRHVNHGGAAGRER